MNSTWKKRSIVKLDLDAVFGGWDVDPVKKQDFVAHLQLSGWEVQINPRNLCSEALPLE